MIVPTLPVVAGPMSAHDHPGLSDVTDLAVAVAFLRRVLSVHEIASCHFDLGSFGVVNVPLKGALRAFPATKHLEFLWAAGTLEWTPGPYGPAGARAAGAVCAAGRPSESGHQDS